MGQMIDQEAWEAVRAVIETAEREHGLRLYGRVDKTPDGYDLRFIGGGRHLKKTITHAALANWQGTTNQYIRSITDWDLRHWEQVAD